MKILVAERDSERRQFVSGQLRDLGWEVVEALDGLDAMRLVSQWHFDCVAIDLGVRRVSGMEVLRRARHEQPSARRIALSRRKSSILESIDPSLAEETLSTGDLPARLGSIVVEPAALAAAS